MNRRYMLKAIGAVTTLLMMGCAYGVTQSTYADGEKELARRKNDLREKGHKIVQVIRRNNRIYEIRFREKK